MSKMQVNVESMTKKYRKVYPHKNAAGEVDTNKPADGYWNVVRLKAVPSGDDPSPILLGSAIEIGFPDEADAKAFEVGQKYTLDLVILAAV
jgi:hypothetical protein